MANKVRGIPTVPFSKLDFGDVFMWGTRVFVKIRPVDGRHGAALNCVGVEHDETEYLWRHEVTPLEVIGYEPKGK